MAKYFVLDANSAGKNPEALKMAVDILKEDHWYELTEERLKPWLSQVSFLLAIEKGKAIGYIEFERNEGLKELRGKRYFTREEHRKRGIMFGLIKELTKHAAKLGYHQIITYGAEPVLRAVMRKIKKRTRTEELPFGTFVQFASKPKPKKPRINRPRGK
ncbi:MAG: GNAT family N-acetyltransferase [archaeon]